MGYATEKGPREGLVRWVDWRTRGGAKLVRVRLRARDSGLGESARFVHEMYKAVQPVAGVKERVEGEVVGVEVGVVLPEDVTEGLVAGTFAYDMMPCLQGRVSDFVCTRAPGGFGWNEALVVLAGVTVTSNGLYNSAKEFAGGIFEDLIGGDRRGDDVCQSKTAGLRGILCPLPPPQQLGPHSSTVFEVGVGRVPRHRREFRAFLR